MSLKICFLGDGCSPIIRSWADYFAHEGHVVDLITANMATPPLPWVSIHRVGDRHPRKLLTWTRIIWRTRRVIKRIRPDVIHAHSIYAYGVPAALSGAHPFVGTQMGDDIGVLTYRSRVARAAVKRVLKNMDMLFAKDIYAEKRALELGMPKERIKLLTSACDTKRFSPEARSRELRLNLGVQDTDVLAIFTRPFTDQYRVDILEKAIPMALKRDDHLKVILLQRGNYQPVMERLGPSNRIIWLPAIPHEEFHRYLASCDMFIDTFVPRDGMLGHAHGTTVTEAMACGLPLILPDKPEFHFPWFNAIMFPIENWYGFALNISDLARDPTWRAFLGKQARQLAVEYFDRSVVMGEAFHTYKTLLCAGCSERERVLSEGAVVSKRAR